MDHDLSNFLLDDGVTHLFMVQHQEAFQSFARIVDPHDLSARIPVAERIRLEVLNYQTLTSLKSSSKDLEQTLHFWKAGIEGARVLQSEQRFAEACVNFETIECIWPGEKRVEHLRDLTIHW